MKELPIKLVVFEEGEYVIIVCEEYEIAVQGRNLPIALTRFGKLWEDFQKLELINHD